jgi:hypothetical protein
MKRLAQEYPEDRRACLNGSYGASANSEGVDRLEGKSEDGGTMIPVAGIRDSAVAVTKKKAPRMGGLSAK